MAWKYTHIDHPIRKRLGINLNEYAVIDFVYRTQTHPSYTKDGWCDYSYQKIADEIGLGKGTIFTIIERAVEWDFIEVNTINPELKRVTPKWYDVVYIENPTDEYLQKISSVRSKNERSKNERNSVQKMNDSVQKMNANNNSNKSFIVNTLPLFESTFEVQKFVEQQKIILDSVEARKALWEIFRAAAAAEFFKDQWEFITYGISPKPNLEETLHAWTVKGDWQDVKSFRIHRIIGFARFNGQIQSQKSKSYEKPKTTTQPQTELFGDDSANQF